MTTDWLHGPGLFAWLQRNGLERMEAQLGYHARMVRHWRDGSVAHVYSVDKVLCKLGLHLSEIPDELWTRQPKRGGPPLPTHKQAEIKHRVLELRQPIKAVAREIGCSPNTVRRYTGLAA